MFFFNFNEHFLFSLVEEKVDTGEKLRLEQLAQGKPVCATSTIKMSPLPQLHHLCLFPLVKLSNSSSLVVLIFTFYFCSFQNSIICVILRQYLEYKNKKNKSNDHIIIEDTLLPKSKPLWFLDSYEHLAQEVQTAIVRTLLADSQDPSTLALNTMDSPSSVSWSPLWQVKKSNFITFLGVRLFSRNRLQIATGKRLIYKNSNLKWITMWTRISHQHIPQSINYIYSQISRRLLGDIGIRRKESVIWF